MDFVGVERVKRGNRNYAFFMESAPIKYEVHRECNLTQVGGLLGKENESLQNVILQLISSYFISSFSDFHKKTPKNMELECH